MKAFKVTQCKFEKRESLEVPLGCRELAEHSRSSSSRDTRIKIKNKKSTAKAEPNFNCVSTNTI